MRARNYTDNTNAVVVVVVTVRTLVARSVEGRLSMYYNNKKNNIALSENK